MRIILAILFVQLAMLSFAQNITRGEYFIDTEPGVGNGNPLSFTSSNDVEFDFDVDLTGLSLGFHNLFIRFQSEGGKWSMVRERPFYVFQLSLLDTPETITAEYFIDQEPGVGNGIPMTLESAGETVEQNFAVNVGDLNPGMHTLYIRTRGDNGQWSLVRSRPFYVIPTPPATENIVGGEFFVDAETGVGLGTPFSIPTPADSVEQTFAFELPELALGQHTLFVRYQHQNGAWGMLNEAPFVICDTYGAQAAFSFTENNNQVFFQNESLLADSILWNFGDGVTSTVDAPIYNFTEQGSYTVSLLAYNECGESILTETITIEGLTSVNPNVVSNTSFASLLISGFGFVEGTVVKIKRTGFDDILPYAQFIQSTSSILATVDFTSQSTGLWDLEVEIPGEGIFVLNEAIEVNSIPFGYNSIELSQVQIAETRTGRRSPGYAHIENNNPSDAIAIPVVFRDIVDVQHIFFTSESPLTSVPFFQETYQMLADDGINNTVMLSSKTDDITNSRFSGFVVPKIAANSSNDIPLYIKRNQEGIHRCTAMMLYPLLTSGSQTGTIQSENDVCLSSFVKAAAESTLGNSFDDLEWNICYASWQDSLFVAIAEMAANPELSSQRISLPACITSILVRISQDGCVTNFPAALTANEIDLINSHVMANFVFLNDAADIAPVCPQMQGLQIDLHPQDESVQSDDRENEFCDLAGEVGGNSFLNSAGAAAQYCKLFGNGVDPNMKYGPGNNQDNVFVNPGDIASYTITFENDTNATAPAEIVHVEDVLDMERFNLESFKWGTISLSDSIIIQPDPHELHQVILSDLRPGKPFYLLTKLDLDTTSGLAEWEFATLDTTNLQPLELELDGFLPPNMDGTEGSGAVTFYIQYLPELITGDTILNDASIVFDFNAPIITPEWMNVVDITAPESAVTDLPEFAFDETFMVTWTGTDSPAGIAKYNVFVSENDGPFLPWIIMQDTLQSEYTGVVGNVYKFYSVAVDRAGNWELAPEDPQNNYDAITSIISSVEEVNSEIGLIVYPVPARDDLNVQLTLDLTSRVEISVLSMTGQLLYSSNRMSGKTGKVTEAMDVSNWASGVYMLQVSINDNVYNSKIVIR